LAGEFNVNPDSEIRGSSDEESADLELLESAFDSSYTPVGNLVRLACAGVAFFLVTKAVHAIFPVLSSRNLGYIGFVVVAVLGTFVDSTTLFRRVPELGFNKNSAVWRVLAESLGFAICVALFFAGLGTPLPLGAFVSAFVVLILLCGIYDVVRRRASEPPLSMNLK